MNPWVLYQPLRLREARLSSRIENTVASAREVAGLPYLSTQRIDVLEVRNYLDAIDLGAKAIGLGEDEPRQITESLIRQLHQRLLRDTPGADRKRPGNYRDRLVYIGDERLGFERARFVPPPASEVPHLMRELVGFMRQPPEGLPALLAVGMAHYQFETIHPFADGNGRLGRMLITLGLCDRGVLSAPPIYPSGYIDANKQEYYDSLLAVSTQGDWGRWLRFFLEAVRSQAVDTLSRMKELLRLREDIRSRAAHRSLSARFLSTIDHLFAEPVITAASLNRAVGGGAQTSRNYIKILCDLDVLKEITGKRRAARTWRGRSSESRIRTDPTLAPPTASSARVRRRGGRGSCRR